MVKIVISNPTEVPNELARVNALFEAGLTHFHLRKPDFSKDDMEAYLKQIKPQFLKRVVIHSYHPLIQKYNLKGINLRGCDRRTLGDDALKSFTKEIQRKGLTISTSCHSFEEIETLPCKFDYVFLSPIYTSISKADYPSAFTKAALELFFQERKSTMPVVALGGITEENVQELTNCGFYGMAFLGSIWKENPLS